MVSLILLDFEMAWSYSVGSVKHHDSERTALDQSNDLGALISAALLE